MRPPTALTIAGSDSGGGAGIQADLKTFLDHRVYGMSVLTAITAQNTRGVSGVWSVPVEGIRAQLEAVFADLPVDVVKIGMLGDIATIEAVANVLAALPTRPPIVLDPVMIAKGGAPLLRADAVAALRARLVPLATLVTPNVPEAEALGDLGSATVLYKGGHAEGGEVVDRLVGPGLSRVWRHPRVHSRNTHGTGCTLASAIAANLAHGRDLPDACDRGIAYVSALLVAAVESLGSGHGPLLHGLGDR
ncbi:MAG: bifunctional hydroxymethylpyrimidine kinase/phosphomethylpyrimidine kinase [Pseudomonadota bacterium]|nr:bifunctional hydroxymethylpyrimidine kinase/phosphomethylpyrimidine kinase [Pseudomonadota bacterium]